MNKYFSQLSCRLINFYRFSVTKPLKAICDARLRSRRMVYPWKSVALDYMPCLWAIDEAFHNSIRNHVNPAKREENPIGTTARTRSKNGYNERAQHPFDIYDQATGLTIDVTEELRTSIAKYAFSNLYRPMYWVILEGIKYGTGGEFFFVHQRELINMFALFKWVLCLVIKDL